MINMSMEGPHGEPEQEKGPKKLKTDMALAEERGVFERLNGNAKQIALAMALVSGLLFSSRLVRDAEAGERQFGQTYELNAYKQAENSQERAIRFLDTLANLPDPKREEPLSKGQIELLKMRAAKVLIQDYAARKKTGDFSGSVEARVTSGDIEAALKELHEAVNPYGERKMKEDDGKIGLNEANDMNQWYYSRSGIKQLEEMFEGYKITDKIMKEKGEERYGE